MRVERHWWNGHNESRRRRDVFICTDGEHWEVLARIGGDAGRSTVHQCPGLSSAMILAGAWMGGQQAWRELAVEPQR